MVGVEQFYRNEVVLTHVERGEQGRFDITPRLSTDSLYAVRKAALEGLGVAIVSSWLVRDDVADGALQTVLPAGAPRRCRSTCCIPTPAIIRLACASSWK